jgi:hypothetical protein
MASVIALLFIVLTIIAVSGAKRKWRAFLTVMLWVFAGLAVGIIAGQLARSSEFGVQIAMPLMFWLGIVGAMGCIRRNKKAKALHAPQEVGPKATP